MVGKKAVLMLVLLSLGLVAATLQPAQTVKTATINFSGLAEGKIVDSLSVGMGISMNQGEPIKGWVTVFGFNPKPLPNFRGANHAMIFNATCPGGCSGEDPDLYFPKLGNVLIISEDHNSSDPDDADWADAYFEFNFSKFGPGKVDVKTLVVADADDAEEFGEIKVKRGGRNGVLVKQVHFDPTGNNQKQVVSIDAKDIDYMEVDLNGSGAIDNIEIVVKNGNGPKINLELDGTCYPPNTATDNMKFSGTLTRDGDPIANHEVTLSLPNGENEPLKTNNNGHYEYTFEGARNYIGQDVTASANVDGQKASDTHLITEEDFAGCSPVTITLDGECEPQGQLSNDLRLKGILTRDGNPIPNHPIRLSLPDGSEVPWSTDDEGKISYLFEDSRKYINQTVTAVASVDGVDYPAQHEITEKNFEGCEVEFEEPAHLDLNVACEKKEGQEESHDLQITAVVTDNNGNLWSFIPIRINLPNGNIVSLDTDQAGQVSYLFEGADQYNNQIILVETTGLEENKSDEHEIAPSDFKGCQKKRGYVCHNVFLTTFHGQPIELGSQIPGWGLVDTHIVCIGRGQGKSCRLKVKGEPGYVVKSSTLEMDVPRLLPYVNYQAQIKGYDGNWTDDGCEFSFITGGHVASTSTHLSDQVDPLGWISLGEGQSAIKPLGVCSGWSDACQFTENIIGFHLDDIYGNQLPGSKLSLLQPGDRISIYRDHRLYTYEFTGSERVRQSAEGNQAILDAAKQHDLVLTTCSGYRLIDEGGSSHTRLATFTLLPRVERLYLGH